MRVRAERVESAWVLHLQGRLTVEEDTRQLHELVRAMVHFAPCNVVLDIGNVGQLDCSGIGQLVQLREQVRESGGAFALLNVECRQKRLLELLKLLGPLGVCGSRHEAIKRSAAAWPGGISSAGLQVPTDVARPPIDRVVMQGA